ncbi:hypothetical protein [Saccharolobus caldissimus]|uniref:Uncharacterized protein n=1 Tax=Saccharolobus caldissimus TaxID=1702097 RepID=A0AAQ4CNP9_9CREN|nr:hypothetical protein [Saccharolobus caldissimus]BDB97430.1 hypothetical protein SACC_04470 [Saccharolobus caldissimus]
MRISGKKLEKFCYTDKYYSEYVAFCYDAKISIDDAEFNDKDIEEIVEKYEKEIIEILRDKGYRTSESKSKKITLQNYKKLEDWMK